MNNQNTINLKGLAIGNGCWGNTVGTCAFNSGDAMSISANFYYGHAMYSQPLYNNVTAACGNFSTISPACATQLALMNTEIGSFDVYNIYDTCGSDDLSGPGVMDYFAQDGPGEPYHMKAFAQENWIERNGKNGLPGEALNDYECGGETAMDAYLAEPSVQAALHVRGNTAGQSYKKTATDLRPLYKQLVSKYRVLIYSGDADACVPYYGTEGWTYNLGYSVVETWRPWQTKFNSGHTGVGGYVTKFQNNFYFLTIKGAGHMVPTFKPAPALTFISKWLANQPF